MPADASPYILIAAKAPLAQRLAELVARCRPDLATRTLEDGQAALERCREKPPVLALASGDLPGLDGIALLRELRRHLHTSRLPFVLVDGPTDSASVRAALPLAPSAYLAPPFAPEKLEARLTALLQTSLRSANAANAVAPTVEQLDAFIERAREEGAGAPMFTDMSRALAMRLDAAGQDLVEVEHLFLRDPQVTARLITRANDSRGHDRRPVTGLAAALGQLGVLRSLNLALDIALQSQAQLAHPLLAERAAHYAHQAQHAAELSAWLAARLDLETENCYTAGLLHNMGDLSVLRVLQRWADLGGAIDEAIMDKALAQHAGPLAASLRTQWRLPFTLRELIAAYYELGSGVFAREALVMNLTGQLLRSDPSDSEQLAEERAARLLRLRPELLRQWLGLLQR